MKFQQIKYIALDMVTEPNLGDGKFKICRRSHCSKHEYHQYH